MSSGMRRSLAILVATMVKSVDRESPTFPQTSSTFFFSSASMLKLTVVCAISVLLALS